MTVQSLADTFTVSKRTIHNDNCAAGKSGIEFEKKPSAGIKAEKQERRPAL